MYEGVHNLHHARTRYGTVDDPEYLPLASMKPWTLPLFIVTSILAPVALIVRYGVLTPLSLVVPGMHRVLVERYSSLSINPAFRRRAPEGEGARLWWWLEGACSVWAVTLIVLVATGVFPLPKVGIALAITSGVYILNQVRTLVAHLWDNHEGETMSVTAQYLDTVNVPPPAFLPVLWAPVGLRYHALHHLLPSLPYHSLAEAHRGCRRCWGRNHRITPRVTPGCRCWSGGWCGVRWAGVTIANRRQLLRCVAVVSVFFGITLAIEN